MGADYYNYQVFAGQKAPEAVKQRLLSALGFREACQVAVNVNTTASAHHDEILPDVPAAISVGPVGRWITIYDSWFGPDDDSLALRLSRIAPIVLISMDDSAAVHFVLYRHGEVMDQFANRSSIITRWESEEQKQRFRGRPELWSDLLLDSSDTSKLRLVWEEDRDASGILDATISLFGWHPLLSSNGYTVDHDGIPEYYREYVGRLQKMALHSGHQNETLPWVGNAIDLNAFTEFEPDLPFRAT